MVGLVSWNCTIFSQLTIKYETNTRYSYELMFPSIKQLAGQPLKQYRKIFVEIIKKLTKLTTSSFHNKTFETERITHALSMHDKVVIECSWICGISIVGWMLPGKASFISHNKTKGIKMAIKLVRIKLNTNAISM